MSDLTMKDYSNYLDEKPFSCDVDGCSMKFINEDHLAVHKKKHEMVLNLGLGCKGNTFVDQTPTPTRFIRNCEEVGLFQDLQNVNPFEETFRKAAEANKTGQTPCLERTILLNPSDDTLHTPNVFPLITDIPCMSQRADCTQSDKNQEGILKETLNDGGNVNVDSLPLSDGNLEIKKPSEKNVSTTFSHKKRKNDKSLILKVPEAIQPIAHEKIQGEQCYNMVVLENAMSNEINIHDSVKEKLYKSISEKKVGDVSQLKVPIPKAPLISRKSSTRNTFSTFSKNSMKLISKIENPDTGIFDLKYGRRKKKDSNHPHKESRSEFLARNRAAATRCREKKKLYVSYLEKLNRELTDTNQNLQMLNLSLKKQVLNLHKELLRHKNCSIADVNTEIMINNGFKNMKRSVKILKSSLEGKEAEKCSNDLDNKDKPEGSSTIKDNMTDTVLVDYVEVVLDNNRKEDSQVPLLEENKSTDIIVRFNSNKNDYVSRFELDELKEIGSQSESMESVKQVLNEHCYFTKQVKIGLNKKFVNYNHFSTKINSSSLESEKVDEIMNDDIDDDDDDDSDFKKDSFPVSLVPNKVVLNSTPPPLILLKPFKKRSLISEQTEKL